MNQPKIVPIPIKEGTLYTKIEDIDFVVEDNQGQHMIMVSKKLFQLDCKPDDLIKQWRNAS